MMALFGMVWLLKVRKHLRSCPHCRAHLRTCNECKSLPPNGSPRPFSEGKDSSKVLASEELSPSQKFASQDLPSDEFEGISLDLVSHDPSTVLESQSQNQSDRTKSDDNNSSEQKNEASAIIQDLPVLLDDNQANQFKSFGQDSPTSQIPPPPPPVMLPHILDSKCKSPRKKLTSSLSEQKQCENITSSIASRVCSIYGCGVQKDQQTDSFTRERRRSFSSSRTSLKDIVDSSNHLSTLPRHGMNGNKVKFCYTKGHTHPFSCSTLSLSTSFPHLPGGLPHDPSGPKDPMQSYQSSDLRTHSIVQRSISVDTNQGSYNSPGRLNNLSDKNHSRALPPLTLDPRLLPVESSECPYSGSDSSRSSHSGSKSTYSEPSANSLPPPAAFDDGASNFLPTSVYSGSKHLEIPRTRWGSKLSSNRTQKCAQELRFNNGMWFIPTKSHTTTFLGPDYPQYDPTTVPGSDRKFHRHPPHHHFRNQSRQFHHHPHCHQQQWNSPSRMHQSPSMGSVGANDLTNSSTCSQSVPTSSSFCALHGFSRKTGKELFYFLKAGLSSW